MIFQQSCWPHEAFWQVVTHALRQAMAEAPQAEEGRICDLILREWLAFSVPSGRC